MYVLGIETSCDETSCSVVYKRKVLSNVTVSSLPYHKKYGGIVPEIATRNHLKFIDRVCNLALKEAGISFKKIKVIGVTTHPGLLGSLVVGVNFAKGLSLSLKKPIIGINHLYAHLFSPFLDRKERIPLPFLGVVVSGGHTELFLVKDFHKIKLIGRTRDDACGEVFDKVARFFGLGFPGGVIIDKLYSPRFKDSFNFRCPRLGFDFSFSGIKTAVIYKKMELEKLKKFDREISIKILSSFQESMIKTIVEVAIKATEFFKVKVIVCGGGVAANSRLRQLIEEEAKKRNLKVLLPPYKYTTDNAAMVAGLTYYLYYNKKIRNSIEEIEAKAN